MIKEILTKDFIQQLLEEGIKEGIRGYNMVAQRFAKNYTKRRNVGFTVGESIKGGWDETKYYYSEAMAGREPIEMIEAVTFEK